MYCDHLLYEIVIYTKIFLRKQNVAEVLEFFLINKKWRDSNGSEGFRCNYVN